MSQPVVFDVETQLTFREAGGYDPAKLKISVVGLYDYATDKYLTFEESKLTQLFPYLEKASLLIGFNIIDFDLPAIKPYYVGEFTKFPTLDLLREIEKSLGHRLSLDDLARETLNAKKTGHGLLAVEYFRNGEMDKLKQYCLSDVELTRNLFEYGKKNGRVYYKSASGRTEIPVSWQKRELTAPNSINLTIPW